MCGHKGDVDGGFAIATLIGFADNIFANGGPFGATKNLVCYLAHHAFVVTKGRVYLKCRMGDGVGEGGVSPVLSEVHREASVRELCNLWKCSSCQVEFISGLREVDAASTVRTDTTTSNADEQEEAGVADCLEERLEQEDDELLGGDGVHAYAVG